MALITCPDCSNSFSHTADACPNCGYVDRETNVFGKPTEIKNVYLDPSNIFGDLPGWYVWPLIIFFFGMLLMGFLAI